MSKKLDCLEEVGWLVKFQPSCEFLFFSPPDWYVLIRGEVGRVKMGATMGGLLRPAGTGWPWRCHIVLPGRALLGARCGADDWDIKPWQKFLPKADLQTLYFRDLCSFHLPFHSFFIKSVENNKVHIPALSHKGYFVKTCRLVLQRLRVTQLRGVPTSQQYCTVPTSQQTVVSIVLRGNLGIPANSHQHH